MKKILLSIIFNCLIIAAFGQYQKFNFSLSTGLFREDFNWSIAGNMEGKDPNVLSELIWTNLKGAQYYISSGYFVTSKIAVNADYSYGKINGGVVNDTDYLEDNRTQSIFDEDFLSNKGYFQNVNLNLLFKKELNNKFTLNATIGYSNYNQKLYLSENPNNPTNKELNSYYKNSWNGLQIGFNLKYVIGKFSITGKAYSGYYKYNASANWNLIPNFKKPISFKHKANAYKYGGSLLLAYPLNKNLDINSAFNLIYGASFTGKDYAYFTDDRVSTTKFNGAELKSSYVQVGLNLHF